MKINKLSRKQYHDKTLLGIQRNMFTNIDKELSWNESSNNKTSDSSDNTMEESKQIKQSFSSSDIKEFNTNELVKSYTH